MTVNSRLRCGTLNVGLALRTKIDAVLQRCLELQLDVLALQEVGDPVDLRQVAGRYGYHSVVNGRERGGTALLIKRSHATVRAQGVGIRSGWSDGGSGVGGER